ncbi:haloacid dehalogenase superfamily, subfamily IA, variant 3 with third motif having DD or ED/haloacid dehalogenase superfamily, subfamily IA, variant 1 with third motif having Dx(3-4)D or Dx(3-4)E [Geodermatophilus dictyosporus]|uniref:D,D-heptose 1,7-bisphosphate phosphatase n=1 Tax=Geodermatophilus dictyosporus TaxID=1523247 RepID=A0A1I5MY63_9ACTN|nr:HAD-IIIA family hydrolase [Geodermatophilus dictyosporus]SFP14555.1 haloacid dehalogenase superfamily, subfamily IA, variant 3 with third motif having DD or ED/haloacid dehalogenase superfamily, subfamily IA, variant 1 with third motif having Dx(3-4)D or Dx(3-4)E [Geodermatophilus dictyosporus]
MLAECTVVVPTIGRPSLDVLLDALAAAPGPRPAELVVVDDRPQGPPLTVDRPGLPPVRVVRTGGGGPARARNLGWRTARTGWIAFLDDDVVPDPDWYERLDEDLRDLPADVAGSQGRVRVPLPADRRPTDWERGTAGLATSSWITADLAYRRAALAAVGGFDERFPRAFREDSDLALRVVDTGSRLVRGQRRITHPVRPTDRWVSLRVQAGNADDVLMRRLHGPDWRERADAALGRRPQHLAVTAAGVAALGLAAARRPRAALAAALAWAAGTAEFARARIAPGPRDRAEVTTMALTSAAIPPLATWHWLRGVVRHRRVAPWRGLPDLVLFDRDGTLVRDYPYNGDPELVRPVPGAREAVDALRARGVRVGVVSNQSGVARGIVTRDQVDACMARLDELLGPFETVQVCPHGPDDGCSCRKPAPGMVKTACAELGVDPARTVVIGDIGADVEAAAAAGASGVLVPTPVTRKQEVAAAPRVAATLSAAVDDVLAGRW